MKRLLTILLTLAIALNAGAEGWIRINQLGYLPESTKIAVLMSTEDMVVEEFTLEDAFTGRELWRSREVTATGPMGRMAGTWRLDFSDFSSTASVRIKAGGVHSSRMLLSMA